MEFTRVTPIGSMDKDTDIQVIGERNYVDAHDIRHRNMDGSQSIGPVNFKGNALRITLPGVEAQAKVYRVFVDVTEAFSQFGIITPPTGTLTLLDAVDGNDTQSFTLTLADLSSYVTNLKVALTSLGVHLTPFNYSALVATGTYTGYFDLSAVQVDDINFILSSTGNLVKEFQVISEGYASTDPVTYNQKIIGSLELDQDLFIVSATTEDFNIGGSPFTVTEVGVVEYDEDTDTHTYTRLLRTRTWLFDQDHGVEIKGEKNGDRVSLYLTDRNQLPRVLYVRVPFVEDGTITSGDYNYDTISEETYMFVRTPAAQITIDEVAEGGAVTCGNKRYTGRFLTESLVGSEYLYPTGLVNIGLGSQAVPHEIKGGKSTDISSQQVKMTVSNIPQGVFKFFELVAIEYSGDSFVPKMVQRYSVGDSTEIEVFHTDLGQDNGEVSFSEILALTAKYEKVGSLEIMNNRMIITNVEEQIDQDLSAWASSITHSLEQRTIQAVDLLRDPTQSSPGYKYGEYQDPNNVLNFTSEMFGDTCRYGTQVKWKSTGKWSKPYWVDDIRFDLSADNITNNLVNRRTGNNIDTNLTDDEVTEAKVYYVNFGNIDLDYVVGSNSLYQLIDAIRFVRAERIPEVLATGIFMLGKDNGGPKIPFDFPFNNTAYAVSAGDPDDQSDYVFFQSPDIFYGVTQYVYQAGDKIRLLGPVDIDTCEDQQFIKSSSAAGNSFLDQSGYFDDQSITPIDFTEITPEAHASLVQGVTVDISPGDQVRTDLESGGNKVRTSFFTDAFKLPAKVYKQIGSTAMKAGDTGLHYGMIFRDKGANLKYPLNKELTVYHSTGHLRVIQSGETGIITEDVFGGDVFTQKSFMPVHNGYYEDPASDGGLGLGYYSQNVANTQMRTVEDQDDSFEGFGYVYPQVVDKATSLGGTPTYDPGTIGRGLANWMEQWPERINQRGYNTAYNIKDGTITESGFDPNSNYTGKRKATIAWSASKTVGSLQDNYRIFKPADFIDLDISKGEIEWHCELNGALYTWQRDSFQRQYFNDPTLIGTDTGSDIIAGTGGILSVRGQELTSIGSDKKWAIFKGKSPIGKDVVYWYNDILKKIVRFGADGDVVISDKGIDSWLKTYANFLRDEEEPIFGRGVHGVWNDRYSEAIFTFKGFSEDIPQWETGQAHNTDDLVWNVNATIDHHSGLPQIFRARFNFTNDFEPDVTDGWETYWEELGPADLPQYYTFFTIVWDERKNGWIGFHEYFPNIYMPWADNFCSTNPLQEHKLYLHDDGDITNYYGEGYQASITAVMNRDPNMGKIFEATQWVSDIQPFRVEFTTKNHTSFLVEDDFRYREDFYYSTIKNNAVAGVVTGNSSRLWGKYLVSKFIYETGVRQNLLNFVVKYRLQNRSYIR